MSSSRPTGKELTRQFGMKGHDLDMSDWGAWLLACWYCEENNLPERADVEKTADKIYANYLHRPSKKGLAAAKSAYHKAINHPTHWLD
jgi:hypothetical protein